MSNEENDINKLFTRDTLACSRELKGRFIKATSRLLLVIEQLEAELEKLKQKGFDANFLVAKDHQINQVIEFQAECDAIFAVYDHLLIHAMFQKRIMQQAAEDILLSSTSKAEFLGLITQKDYKNDKD